MKHRKYYSLLLVFVAILFLTPSLSVWAVERCIVCGMDVSKYPHTHYVVETPDGKTYTTCGVQCGLTLHLRDLRINGNKPRHPISLVTGLLM